MLEEIFDCPVCDRSVEIPDGVRIPEAYDIEVQCPCCLTEAPVYSSEYKMKAHQFVAHLAEVRPTIHEVTRE